MTIDKYRLFHFIADNGLTIPDGPKGCAVGQAAYAAQRELLCYLKMVFVIKDAQKSN
jgi:hypothetical protein